MELDIQKLAELGAGIRYRELMDEAARIRQTFPGVSSNGSQAPEPTITTRGRSMSASGRKAVSMRMKAYWAKRKADEKPQEVKRKGKTGKITS